MKHGIAIAAMLAGLTLGASGALAQSSSSLTTSTYNARSTAKDIRASCKELSMSSQGTLSAKCNKRLGTGAVSAVSTTISMPTYASCRSNGRGGYRVLWGSPAANVQMVDPLVLLTSTGSSYVFGAYCVDANNVRTGPSGIDIGETTDGLENDAGSLAKR